MDRIVVTSQRGEYPVLVGRGLLSQIDAVLETERLVRPKTVVSNTKVGPLYAPALLENLGFKTCFEVPDGEEFKRWQQVESICCSWLEQQLHRGDCVVALGGGVVTDLVGFAASVYLRGIEWIAVPTTLLAMVDAAIGGKTGFNLDQGKNLVGSFWSPQAVVIDIDVLATLESRELRAGLAEVVKSAWIDDQEMLGLIDQPVEGFPSFSEERWHEIVCRTAAVKARVVNADEREQGVRQSLNLGHTLGHAFEAATEYSRFLHGEAVALGMRAALMLAQENGLISQTQAAHLELAVKHLGPLPPIDDLEVEALLEHLARDKKRDDLGVAWVLPTDTGVELGVRVPTPQIISVINELKHPAKMR